jgi:hypothetical protein
MSQKMGKDGKSQQQRATLRHCMSCEWIYKGQAECCPKCSWPSYGAHYVSGAKAYKFAKTQQPWFDKKMADYANTLQAEILSRIN